VEIVVAVIVVAVVVVVVSRDAEVAGQHHELLARAHLVAPSGLVMSSCGSIEK